MHHSRTLRALKSQRYTSAFVYGRHQTRKTAAGRETRKPLPRDQWHTLLLDGHPGYISSAESEENIRRLHENAQANGADRRQGPALLQGLVVCGRCG